MNLRGIKEKVLTVEEEGGVTPWTPQTIFNANKSFNQKSSKCYVIIFSKACIIRFS